MDASELEFDLPDRLIATRPAEPRDSARLLVCSRSDPTFVEHAVFRDLPRYLRPADVLVFNRSGVTPARVRGRRQDSGGRVEGLFVREVDAAGAPAAGEEAPRLVWEAMLKSNGKLRAGVRVALDPWSGAEASASTAADDEAPTVVLTLIERAREGWLVEVNVEGEEGERADTLSVLSLIGATPLPPYILRARAERAEGVDDALDRSWYQTVYADVSRSRSVAAPTAGLHFTQRLIDELTAMGVGRAEVYLHVGPGTFRPIDEGGAVESHRMHAEAIEVAGETLRRLDAAEPPGRRVLVGTTAVRTLESIERPPTREAVNDGVAGETELFITPGFEFRWTDALITNFHLPRSTLLTLVGALFPAGVPRLLELYREAIDREYRFFSYGDAMLILP